MLQLSMVDTIHMVTTDHTTHMVTHTGGKCDLSNNQSIDPSIHPFNNSIGL